MSISSTKIIKKLIKIILVAVVLTSAFVGWNLWKDRNTVNIEQVAAPTFLEVQSSLRVDDESAVASDPDLIDSQGAVLREDLVLQTGRFVGRNNYRAEGAARVVQLDGQNLLVFDDDFSSSNGPDLLIYLAESKVESGEPLGEFVSLGDLQQTSGGQVYVLPDNIDNFQSVVIWCRAFGQLFGAADIR